MRKKHRILCLLLIVLLCVIPAGCAKEDAEEYKVITSLEEVSGCRVGVSPMDSFVSVVQEAYPDCELVYFSSYSDMITGLLTGRIDAYAVDSPVGKLHVAAYPGKLYELEETMTSEDYAFVVSKENTELREQIDLILAEFYADGTLDALNEKWITHYSSDNEVEHDPNATTENGVLRCITGASCEGFSYYKGNELEGYCIELAVKLAEKMHMEVEFSVSDWSGLLPAIQSGKADLIADTLTVTEERKKSVDFCTPFYKGGMTFIVRDSSMSIEKESFFDSVKASFIRTFVTESRWKLILSGLLVTIELAFASAILGTLVGFFYSFALRSKKKWVSRLSGAVSNVLSCTPMVVILMVLYYIIFAKTSLPARLVATIGFTLTFGNTVAGLLNTGVNAVSIGQIEAATALGYKKYSIFTKIVLPQAANHMFEQYKGSIIGLVKETAIVGYITIEDLTRVSDIIRGRTYEAFFPLIATAVIYYLFSQALLALLRCIGRHIEPQSRKNVLKGVKTK